MSQFLFTLSPPRGLIDFGKSSRAEDSQEGFILFEMALQFLLCFVPFKKDRKLHVRESCGNSIKQSADQLTNCLKRTSFIRIRKPKHHSNLNIVRIK